MKKTYHDEIINTFLNNLHQFNDYFNFSIDATLTNKHIQKGEIDIILEGDKGERALIEVKENAKNMYKFLSKQINTYKKYDSCASIYLLLGCESKSLNCKDFTLKQYI